MVSALRLEEIRAAIRQLDAIGEGGFKHLLKTSDLLSITQPVFFDELHQIFDAIHKNDIKGDVMEVGVWDGATAVYMKALAEHYGLANQLWLFDTFEGKFASEKYRQKKDIEALEKYMAWSDLVYPSVETVMANFKKFDLLDENVKILKGDIFDTYANCDAKAISLLRLDVDFYESTLFMLDKFYSKVSQGGYIIIDDYGVEEFNCKDAVDQFRQVNNISAELKRTGNFVAYWIKE